MKNIQLFGLKLLSGLLIFCGLVMIISAPISNTFRGGDDFSPLFVPLIISGVLIIIVGAYLRFKYKRESGIIVHKG